MDDVLILYAKLTSKQTLNGSKMEKDSLTHLTHPMSKHQLMPIWLCEFSLGRETKGKLHKQGVLCSSLKDDTDLAALRQLDNRLLHALSEVF